mgnify:CR=1 FL=1
MAYSNPLFLTECSNSISCYCINSFFGIIADFIVGSALKNVKWPVSRENLEQQ